MDFQDFLKLYDVLDRQIPTYWYGGLVDRPNFRNYIDLGKFVDIVYRTSPRIDNGEWFQKTLYFPENYDGGSEVVSLSTKEETLFQLDIHRFNWKYMVEFIAQQQMVIRPESCHVEMIGIMRFNTMSPFEAFGLGVRQTDADDDIPFWERIPCWDLGKTYIENRPDAFYRPLGGYIDWDNLRKDDRN